MRSILALLLVLVLATVVPAAAARGKVKGLKSSSPASITSRHLKADEKEKEEKEKKNKIPKVKVKGPDGRTCKSSAKATKVEIECRTRSGGSVKATKSEDKETEKEAKEAKEAEEPKEKEADTKEKTADKKESPDTRSAVVEDPKTTGINLTPSEQIRDSIKYVVRTSKEGVNVAIEYKQEVETSTSANKTETEFELMFESVIEYVKGRQTQSWGFGNNGVSTEAYDWDTDEIVQVVPLANWEAIPGIVSVADGVVSYFEASASMESPEVAVGPTGTTMFNFTVSEATVGEHINANSMKIDVRILNFPWQRSDSYLALMCNVDSKKTVQLHHDDEALVSGGKSKLTENAYIAFDEEMQSIGVEAYGAYTWENNAEVIAAFDSNVALQREPVHEVDSTNTIEVVATSPEEQGNDYHQKIAYSFIGDAAHSASEIYWDPEAGVEYGEAPVSAAWASQSMTFVAALFGALLYLA